MRNLCLFAFSLALAGCPAPSPFVAVTATAKALDPGPAPTLRLPREVTPTRARLELTIDPSKPRFKGRIAFELDVRAPARAVWLHATDLTITRAELVVRGRALPATAKSVGEFLAITTGEALAPGAATLTLDYEGPIDQDKSRGIYAVKEADGAPYVYTFFEPVDARRAFPCFDEPVDKIPWSLSITAPTGEVAVANAPVKNATEEGGSRTTRFEDTLPLPSYLIAFVVGAFDVKDAGTAGHHGTKLRFIVPKGRGDETRYAAEITPKIIGALEDYFGMPYPYGKLDVAVVPRFWGTMEHPGIVALGQPLTLIPPKEETLDRKQAYTNIASHELAHYWFGDYVTTAWWDDTWLNEAFGEWMDATITDAVEPSWKFYREKHARAEDALSADALASARAIRQPIATRDDIEASFEGATTYSKGSSVISMFESWMTKPKFQSAIRRYMKDNANRAVDSSAVFAAIDREAGAPLSKSLRTFLDQPGAPLVSAEPVCSPGHAKLALAQRRYMPRGSKSAPASWEIPVCVRYPSASSTKRACTMLTQATGEIDLGAETCPAWVLPNADAEGYYRSLFSKAALAVLSGKASAMLTKAERARVLSDVAALVKSGDLALGDALVLVPDAFADGDLLLARAAGRILGATPELALPSALNEKRVRYVRRVVGPRARLLGWTKKPGEELDATLLRPEVLALAALYGEDKELRVEGAKLGKKWLDDPSTLEHGLVATALMCAARENDPALFDRIFATAKAQKNPDERTMLYGVLGGFSDPKLAQRALDLIGSGAIDPRDAMGLFFTVLYQRETRELAYEFLKKNLDGLSSRLRADEAMYFFEAPAAYCDETHRAEAEAFFGPRAEKIDGAAHAFAGTLERIRLCAEALKADLPSLEVALKNE